jgi:hypothetical protein
VKLTANKITAPTPKAPASILFFLLKKGWFIHEPGGPFAGLSLLNIREASTLIFNL